MTNIYRLALAGLILAATAHAEPDDICEDLYAHSCAPGVFDDGTGSSEVRDLQEDLAQLQEQFTKEAEEEFHKLVKNPNQGLLRRQALSAFGLNNSPQCKGEVENLSDSCLGLMAKELAREAGRTYSQSLSPKEEQDLAGAERMGHEDFEKQPRLRDRVLLRERSLSIRGGVL